MIGTETVQIQARAITSTSPRIRRYNRDLNTAQSDKLQKQPGEKILKYKENDGK